jgi:hypothetical protein
MNKAYEEYVQNRSSEIIDNDEICITLNSKILRLEKELLPLLSQEAQAKYLKIDELSAELTDRVCVLLPRQFYDNYDKIPIIFERVIPKF